MEKKNNHPTTSPLITVLFVVCILEYFCISDYSQFARQGGLSETAPSDCFRLDDCSHPQFKPESCPPLQPNSCTTGTRSAWWYHLLPLLLLQSSYNKSQILLSYFSNKIFHNHFPKAQLKLPSFSPRSYTADRQASLIVQLSQQLRSAVVLLLAAKHLSAGGKPLEGSPRRSFSSGNFFPC